MPGLKSRKLNRLKSHDYTQPGYYGVTICTHNRELLFGEIKSKNEYVRRGAACCARPESCAHPKPCTNPEPTMHRNKYGEIVREEMRRQGWPELPYPIVHSDVCWHDLLVEIDGSAVIGAV